MKIIVELFPVWRCWISWSHLQFLMVMEWVWLTTVSWISFVPSIWLWWAPTPQRKDTQVQIEDSFYLDMWLDMWCTWKVLKNCQRWQKFSFLFEQLQKNMPEIHLCEHLKSWCSYNCIWHLSCVTAAEASLVVPQTTVVKVMLWEPLHRQAVYMTENFLLLINSWFNKILSLITDLI